MLYISQELVETKTELKRRVLDLYSLGHQERQMNDEVAQCLLEV